jgi:hypothetical protein
VNGTQPRAQLGLEVGAVLVLAERDVGGGTPLDEDVTAIESLDAATIAGAVATINNDLRVGVAELLCIGECLEGLVDSERLVVFPAPVEDDLLEALVLDRCDGTGVVPATIAAFEHESQLAAAVLLDIVERCDERSRRENVSGHDFLCVGFD